MTNTNQPDYMVNGRNAGKALMSADKQGAKGESFAIAAIHEAFYRFEWDYTVERKADEYDDTVTARINDMYTPIATESGKVDSKANSTRKAAFIQQLFGIDERTPAQNTCIDRAMTTVRYLHHINANVSISSGGILAVPYHAMTDAPAADASERAKLSFEATKDVMEKINGTKGMSLNVLRKRGEKVLKDAGIVKKAKRNTKSKVSDAKSFAISLKFVNQELATMTGEDNECNYALTDADRRTLFIMQQSIADLFKADPLDETLETIAA